MVNIDNVYQKVLVLANKEQRGYITPQEFNLFANQAQMDIFEQYFYDLNQFGRIPGNDTEYSDILNYLEQKINVFETSKSISINTATGEFYNASAQINDLYRIGSVSYNYSDQVQTSYGGSTSVSGSGVVTCEQVNAKDIVTINSAPLTKPTESRPIYVLKDNKIYIYPTTINNDIIVNYIKIPKKVNWTYIIVGEKPLVNPGAADYQDFELHPSEETKLVIKILGLAGITLKDPALYQTAGAEDNKNIQQEKQ